MANSPLNGTWSSSVGSMLTLEVHGTEVSGTFNSTQDPTTVPVHGSSADSESDFIPVSFSASWPSGEGYGPSVTSYTGQYTKKDGHEQIEVIFILANQVNSTVLWKVTSIASDMFERAKP